MADVAFGVIGLVGVVLDVSIATYSFISSIVGAPKAIKTLELHTKLLVSFLEPFHDLISKPVIRNRAQNVRFIPVVEDAVSGFEGVLRGLEKEVRLYVKYVAGSSKPHWGGWGSWRRVKYALNKSSIVELEASLLGRMAALHMALAPMDLSWTEDLTSEDQKTIATLQRRASDLNTVSIHRGASTSSLASQRSGLSWAGIDDTDPASGDSLQQTAPGQTSIEMGTEEPSQSEDNDEEKEDNPFRRKTILHSGEQELSVIAVIDTGSDMNLVDKHVITKLGAPVNRLTTTPISRTLIGNEISTEGTALLVMRFTDSSEYTEVRFHVVSGAESRLPFDVVLGYEWLKSTYAFRNLMR